MRGARARDRPLSRHERIIPADAGSTYGSTSIPLGSGDHPRGCGEHMHHMPGVDLQEGSSPRMRGALRTQRGRVKTQRIIPADAGSTMYRPLMSPSSADHPRGCGEHGFAYFPHILCYGSSPRMRGAHQGTLAGQKCRGIIPADAGSTAPGIRRSPDPQDHPRGCGEHGRVYPSNMWDAGSSPRMRGAPGLADQLTPEQRIIPADAGSTNTCTGTSLLHEDHPRGCGEHSSSFASYGFGRGSSPRMRGARRSGRRQPLPVRIIPADAGSTRYQTIHVGNTADHPRGCGEHRSTCGTSWMP